MSAATLHELRCVLLVDSSPTGDQFSQTCNIASPSTPCGACMTQSCPSELSACCGDTTCRTVLAGVDECAEAGTCIFDMSNASAAALGQCIDTRCTVCNAEPASAFDGGQIYCSTQPSAPECSCASGEGFSNSQRCDITLFQNALCCADQTWPAAGTSCTCGAITCSTFGTTDQCQCGMGGTTSDTTTCNASSGWLCCGGTGVCDCEATGSPPCSTGSQVSDCTRVNAVGCMQGQVRVNNCSPSAQ